MNSRVLFVLLSLLPLVSCRYGDLCVYRGSPTFAVCVCQLSFSLVIILAQYEQSPEIDNFWFSELIDEFELLNAPDYWTAEFLWTVTAITSATYIPLAGKTKTSVRVGDKKNNGNLRIQMNSSFPWLFQRHPCVLLEPLMVPWQSVGGVHLRWANPVIQSSRWLLAVFGGVVLVVLIGAITRIPACWGGLSQAIMSDLLQWAVNGELKCT